MFHKVERIGQREIKMNAFITGSRAYGKPTANSDVDLVIRVNTETAQELQRLSDNPFENQGGVVVVRYGKLNLIVCETDEQYAVWRLGTSELTMRGEWIPKEIAHEVFKTLREKVNVRDLDCS